MWTDWSVNILSKLNRIEELVQVINHELNFLSSLNLNIYDTENPEYRLKEVEYDPSADEIFFKCQYTENGVDED